MEASVTVNENWSIWAPPLANVEPLDPTRECPDCGSTEHKFWECPDAVDWDDPEPRAPVEPRPAPPEAVQRIAPRPRVVRASRSVRSRRTSTSPPATDSGEDGEPPGGRAASPVHQQGAAVLVPPSSLKLHPSAELVPPMRPAEYRNLLADVRQHGIQVPLEVQGDIVLDGRHRLRVALELGLAVVPVVQVTPADPLAHLVRAAVLRRHLSDDQRAVVAALYVQKNPRRAGRPADEMRAHGVPHSTDRHPARAEAAAVLGVTPAKVKKATTLLNQSPELAQRVHAGEMKLATALRTVQRREQLGAIQRAHLPEGVYRTIVADPPWRYQDAGCSGAAENHYPTMSLEEICALPIREHAAEEAHLYLWTTGPMLPVAFKVLEAWGFRYVTKLTWKKPHLGLGRYFRSQTEDVLFGVRGKLPVKAQDISNFFEAPQGRHSEKPEEFAALVERASPGPYLELFARRQRPGWTCWGAEVGAPVKEDSTGIIGSTPEVKPEGSDS